MAKQQWPWKFLTKDQMDIYKSMSKTEVVETLKVKADYLDQMKKDKKGSQSLKDFRQEINEFRKSYDGNKDIEDIQAELKAAKEKRDSDIDELIESKKALEGGFSDHIKGAEEHRDALIKVMRHHKYI